MRLSVGDQTGHCHLAVIADGAIDIGNFADHRIASVRADDNRSRNFLPVFGLRDNLSAFHFIAREFGWAKMGEVLRGFEFPQKSVSQKIIGDVESELIMPRIACIEIDSDLIIRSLGVIDDVHYLQRRADGLHIFPDMRGFQNIDRGIQKGGGAA